MWCILSISTGSGLLCSSDWCVWIGKSQRNLVVSDSITVCDLCSDHVLPLMNLFSQFPIKHFRYLTILPQLVVVLGKPKVFVCDVGDNFLHSIADTAQRRHLIISKPPPPQFVVKVWSYAASIVTPVFVFSVLVVFSPNNPTYSPNKLAPCCLILLHACFLLFPSLFLFSALFCLVLNWH